MYANQYQPTANISIFYENCRQFLESQILNCDDIELKKELIHSYNELIKSVLDLDKTHITSNTDWNKTSNTNLANQNMAYNQNHHATQQAHINANSQILTHMVQHPEFTPPNNVFVNPNYQHSPSFTTPFIGNSL